MLRVTLRSTFAVVVLSTAMAASAQQAAPASPAKFTGCVQVSSGTVVLSAPNVCAVLKGKISADQVTGHQIELKGVLSPATKSSPATIQVDSVSSVGPSCSETCAVRPRGRGLHPPAGTANEVPGSEGGTPGAPMH